MPKGKICRLLVVLALLVAACATAPTQPPATGNLPQTEDDVPRVTAEQAKAALDSGEAVIVDVRRTGSFVAGHIAGALSIPLTRIEDNPASVRLDKSQWIITYCT